MFTGSKENEEIKTTKCHIHQAVVRTEKIGNKNSTFLNSVNLFSSPLLNAVPVCNVNVLED